MFYYGKNELKRTGIKQQKLFTDNLLSPQYEIHTNDNSWRAGLMLPRETLQHNTTLLSKYIQIGIDDHNFKKR